MAKADIELTKLQYEILTRLDYEYCYPYSWLNDIKVDMKEIKKEVKNLRELGLVEFHSGLINEEGEVAGSGHNLSYKNLKLINQLKEKYERENCHICGFKKNEKGSPICSAPHQMSTQDIKETMKKRHWSLDQWKNSEDIIDRTVWMISILSPHNMWKGYEAIQNLINEREDLIRKEEQTKHNIEMGKMMAKGYNVYTMGWSDGAKGINREISDLVTKIHNSLTEKQNV